MQLNAQAQSYTNNFSPVDHGPLVSDWQITPVIVKCDLTEEFDVIL